MLRLVPLALAAVITTAAFHSKAFAGSQEDQVSCANNSDRSGYCDGNFRAFGRHIDARTQVQFNTWMVTPRLINHYFWARVGDTTHFCAAPDWMAPAWQQAVNFEGHFRIRWNSSGECISLVLTNGSQYRSYEPAPLPRATREGYEPITDLGIRP